MSIFTRKNKIFTTPILEISLDKIIANYNTLAKIAAPAVPSAVVKDDAYGLNAAVVAQALYEKANCRHFWVAHAKEGARIADLVPEASIYVLQGIGTDSLEDFEKYRLIPVISSPEMLRFWKQNSIDGIKPVIHVETGLNRLGFRREDLEQLSSKDLQMFSMVISHLACADEKDHFMNQYQLDNFSAVRQQYFKDIPASLAASDGAFLGRVFYRENQMQNVVKLQAPVLQIAHLAKGQFVGYSATYRATTDRMIAIISIGYGDGCPRSLSNVGKVLFSTKRGIREARIIGRVSMDNIICDVTDIEELEVGMFGDLICDEYTLDDIARDAGTISYEILSRIGKNTRFIRRYTGNQ